METTGAGACDDVAEALPDGCDEDEDGLTLPVPQAVSSSAITAAIETIPIFFILAIRLFIFFMSYLQLRQAANAAALSHSLYII
jgi:hypothetical protein